MLCWNSQSFGTIVSKHCSNVFALSLSYRTWACSSNASKSEGSAMHSMRMEALLWRIEAAFAHGSEIKTPTNYSWSIWHNMFQKVSIHAQKHAVTTLKAIQLMQNNAAAIHAHTTPHTHIQLNYQSDLLVALRTNLILYMPSMTNTCAVLCCAVLRLFVSVCVYVLCVWVCVCVCWASKSEHLWWSISVYISSIQHSDQKRIHGMHRNHTPHASISPVLK